MTLAPETIDALLFETRLAQQPGLTARAHDYWQLRSARTAWLLTLGRHRLEQAATSCGLITLPGHVETLETHDIADRISACLFSKRQDVYLEALGVEVREMPAKANSPA